MRALACVLLPLTVLPQTAIAQGLFVSNGQSLGNSASNAVELGDLDGDGDLDAVLANGSRADPEPSEIRWNLGNGTFNTTPTTLVRMGPAGTDVAMDAQSVAVGDLDGDGDLDLVFAREGPDLIQLNQGNLQAGTEGHFEPALGFLDIFDSVDVALLDVEPDGDLDIVIVNGDGTPHSLYINDGTAGFQRADLALGNFPAVGVATADFDGANGPDIAIAGVAGSDNQLWLNNGGGGFSAGVSLATSEFPSDVAAIDLDGNGDPDLWFSEGGGDRIFFNNGGVLSLASASIGTALTGGVDLGDVDGDNLADAVVAEVGFGDSPQALVWTHQAPQTFELAQVLGLGRSRDVALGDLDNDADLDVFIATAGPDLVWINGDVAPAMSRLATVPPFNVASSLIFGHVLSGTDSREFVIEIANVGDEDLTVVSVGVNQAADVYQLALTANENPVELPAILGPGQRFDLAVVCSPPFQPTQNLAFYDSLLTLTTDDPVRPQAFLRLGCTGVNQTKPLEEVSSLFVKPSLATPNNSSAAKGLPGLFSCNGRFVIQVDSGPGNVSVADLPVFAGGGSVSLPDFSGTATVTLDPIPGIDSACGLRLESGSFSADSFRLPNGLETGLNVLGFVDPETSIGSIDLATGRYQVTAAGVIVNDFLPAGFHVTHRFAGVFDGGTGEATITSDSRDFIEDPAQSILVFFSSFEPLE